jgi:predicted Zn finger-like uncharacterized protein
MDDPMEIACPNCYATYPIKPERIPEQGATPTCKRCGVAFTVVKATGDPLKDRAQRMKGYVLVRESRKEELFPETESLSRNRSQATLSAKAILENKHFRLGACIAGVVLVLFSVSFFLWKNQVHSRFEKALKDTLAQGSSERFTLAFDAVSFSILGGLGRDQGCIHGLAITDRETRETLKVAHEIHFELEASRKHFMTKPFDVHLEGKHSKSVLKGCVFEAEEKEGLRLEFKVDEAFSIMNGMELFTLRGMEISFSMNGTEWKENPSFVLGEGVFGLRAKDMEVRNEAVASNVDILVSIKNGLFAKDRHTGEASRVSHMDVFRTKWGENKAVAALDQCSLLVLGSAVKATGRLAFQNPVEESEASLRVSVKDFSHIMKYIHRLNEGAFDGIVAALVTLDEKKAAVYKQDSDSLDLTLSYKNARIKINDQELRGLI